jgi:hypothetical protein
MERILTRRVSSVHAADLSIDQANFQLLRRYEASCSDDAFADGEPKENGQGVAGRFRESKEKLLTYTDFRLYFSNSTFLA